jgi:hypothetical protein
MPIVCVVLFTAVMCFVYFFITRSGILKLEVLSDDIRDEYPVKIRVKHIFRGTHEYRYVYYGPLERAGYYSMEGHWLEAYAVRNFYAPARKKLVVEETLKRIYADKFNGV